MSLGKLFSFIFVLSFPLIFSACSPEETSVAGPIDAAVASEKRFAEDIAKDDYRKPAQILDFFGVKQGMNVIDIFSGGGYYTEMLSHVVGDQGSVIAHNNEGYKNFANEEIIKRYAGARLQNTQQYWAEANEMQYEANSADLVMLVLGFHDIFYMPEDQSWPTIDIDAFLNSIIVAMKDGAVLAIVDHRAIAGAPSTTGHALHRIDPAIVIEELTKRGLVLEAESDILANSEDDLITPMWDPSIKSHTDRFVMRFRKPAVSAVQ